MRRPTAAFFVAAAAACELGGPGPATLSSDDGARLDAARRAAAAGPETQLRYGQVALEVGRLFEAAEAFRAAETAGLRSAAVYAGQALTYVRLGYAGRTVGALRQCFQRSPREPDCLLAFARLIESDSTEGAQREVQRTWARFLLVAPSDHPERAYAQSALAQLNGRFGPLSEDEIRGAPPREAASRPSPPPPGSLPGHEGGEGEDAIGELNPFGKALQRAYAAWADKKLDAAETAFREALALREDDAITLAELGRLLLEGENPDEALKLVDQAWTLAPEEPQVRFAFGLVNLRNRRRGKEALEAWQALLQDSPQYARELGVERLLEEAIADQKP